MNLVGPRMLLVFAAIIALGWVGYAGMSRVYGGRTAPIEASIEKLQSYLADASQERIRHARIDDELDAIAARTLGDDLETVDHALRTRLNRIGEQVGLAGLTVNTGRHTSRQTPARSQLRRGPERVLRDEIDFVELEGTIAGEGSLEQALRLVHRIDSAAWIKRIDTLRLDPKEGGDRVAVTLRLTTLFLPDRAPKEPLPSEPDPPGFDRYLALAGRSPFLLPAPAPPPAPPPPAPAPAAAFDYGGWVITGIVEGPGGAEVWLRHAGGESRSLSVGQSLDEATFTAARGDVAEFTLGTRRFLVAIGQSMANRRPLRD